MASQSQIIAELEARLNSKILSMKAGDCVTVEVALDQLHSFCEALRDDEKLCFDQLMDVCGVDYLEYGESEWRTDSTESGYTRGVSEKPVESSVREKPRFAVIYHLLSLKYNHRLRIRTFLSDTMTISSVNDIWASADWFEREAFDLLGIVFEGHPDLRRILTDYGFKGHPFRRDFPLIGEVEMRYDAAQARCVYEPVSIQPRVLVPKVIRNDHRYISTDNQEENPDA